MSIQSEWLEASKDEPAVFDLEYAIVKVQAVSTTGGLQVRLATEFDCDWQEDQFREWYDDMNEAEYGNAFEALYPMLKELRASKSGNDWALLNAAITEIEQCNSGLIHG